MRRVPLLLVSAVLATAVACGGDDAGPAASPAPSSASPTPSALTKEAWVAAVNAICKRVDDATASLPDEPQTAREFLDGTKTYLDALKKGQAEVRALTPPPADAAVIETNFTAVNDRQIEILEGLLPELESAASRNNKDAAEAALQKGFEQYEKASPADAETWRTEYGLTDCG